jgi:hypothetical protein
MPDDRTAPPLAMAPDILILAAQTALARKRRTKTTLARVNALIAEVERTDTAAMLIAGKHPGNPRWVSAVAACEAAMRELARAVEGL